ncbi:hypothetical protein EW146_g10328 [Bondarzewia mesenterica]|uniref:Uncharacterized protein n=1 Tax=Bondarzewia mesenterica TaxID=1095465 RepID=A0A4S4L019_9AGAM|nr:hypothetical protein EW146_g10328 [Bondarzewia mesenterica]
MPKTHPWRTYAKWRNLYGIILQHICMPIRIDVRFLPLYRAVLDAGDIIYMRAFGNSVMVLNSAKVADDLLDKRGAIYSSRPERAMVRDV